MSCAIRIGAVRYLNSKPLIYGIEQTLPECHLVLDVPSRLADRLAVGSLDIALIPVIEYFRGRNYRVLENIAIASRGPVLSVTLFSRQPWRAIRKVAIDPGSRTSAALTQILLSKRYITKPELVPLPADSDPERVDADAVLLIGDRAMRACLPGFAHAFDLGQEWHEWTGLPFVFAVWAVRAGVDLGEVGEGLYEAKRRGAANAGHIAQEQAAHLGLDPGFCRRYLTNIIQFDLGPRELEGLRRFYALAVDAGLVDAGVALEFYRGRSLIQSR